MASSPSETLLSLERKNNARITEFLYPCIILDDVHDKLNIISNTKTHGGRVYGHQELEKAGVDMVSADVAEGW
jgi:hypothetical protein